jgi:radical SAM protein with 4Fe4S-binding SPASM domain
MTRKIGMMEFELFQKIVDQLKRYVNHYVCLHGFGDSLLHPSIGEFIHYAAEKGFRTTLSTNPSSLHPKVIKTIFASRLYRLIISLDGTNATTYQYLRGTNADYEQAIKNIHAFLITKLKEGRKYPLTEISMIRMKETEAEIAHFKQLWKIPGIDNIFIKTFKTWDGSQPDIIAMAEAAQYSPAFHNPSSYPCIRPWLIMSILWDGRVVPCCYDYDAKYVLGNVKDETIWEIWNSKRMRDLRNSLLSNDYTNNPLCAHCREREGAPPSRLYPLNLVKLLKNFGINRIYNFVKREGN